MTDANILPHCVLYLCCCSALRCVLHVTFEDNFNTEGLFRRTVSLAPNRREWHHHAIRHGQYWVEMVLRLSQTTHTHTNTHTHTAYNYTQRHMMLENIQAIHCYAIFCKLLTCSPLLISPLFRVYVCYGFHTNHSLLSVVQTNTSVPPGFSPCVSAAMWATWLTDGKDSDKVTVPKRRGKKKMSLLWKPTVSVIQQFGVWWAISIVLLFTVFSITMTVIDLAAVVAAK